MAGQFMKSSVFKRALAGTGCAGIGGLALAAVLNAFSTGQLVAAANTATSGLRGIFMNGTDISGARNQFLKNVDVQISESGDIFIIAPHYQVSEEDAYTPLSRFVQGINAPAHKPPQKVSQDGAAPPVTKQAFGQPTEMQGMKTPDGSPMAQPTAKAGTPLDPVAQPATEKVEDPPPALPE